MSYAACPHRVACLSLRWVRSLRVPQIKYRQTRTDIARTFPNQDRVLVLFGRRVGLNRNALSDLPMAASKNSQSLENHQRCGALSPEVRIGCEARLNSGQK